MAMSEVLLINPAKRRRTKARRKNPSAAQLRARARFAAASRARSANPRKRRRNPISQAAAPMIANPRRRARRRNPALRSYRAAGRARRRNPIGLSGLSINSIMSVAKEAAVMGAGAVAMDIGYGYVQKYLPASMQAGPGQANLGAAVKAVLTVAAGQLLSRQTNGLSKKAALGALVVQARDLVSGMLPAGTVAGLGYATPGRVINRTARVGPNSIPGMAGYTGRGGVLLDGNGRMGAYNPPGAGNVLLSGGMNARQREGYPR